MHRFAPESFGLPSEPQLELQLRDDAATRAFGAAVARIAAAEGHFIGLVGELGAGKTTFVQGLVGELGGAHASSPTYTLLNVYDVDPIAYHFDLYRLESPEDLETVGYWDYAEERSAVVLVEWIDRIPSAWFGAGAIIELTHRGGGRRAAVWLASPDARWLSALQALVDLS